MDDAEFLEELAKLEHRPGATRRPLAAAWDLAAPMLDEPAPAAPDEQDAWPTRQMFVEPDPPPAADPSAARIALSIGGFLLLMCVGAAGAALVFHARLAQILH